MSGLIALFDDVAAIAKVAAASVDDVIGQAAKAGSKAAGAVIDDAAVSPKYVQGFEANRELPIIWRITKGSLKNKLVFLLPAGLLLSNFAPWLISPLLMLGGCYLCFEGAEKVAHTLGLSDGHGDHPGDETMADDPAHLEEQKAAGAIKTDFILSAEIMTIALAAIPPRPRQPPSARNHGPPDPTQKAQVLALTASLEASKQTRTCSPRRHHAPNLPGKTRIRTRPTQSL